MCQCWCGWRGCSNPVPLREGLPFHRDSSPACFNTRHTLAGLTAATSASSIMNVNRRYPSNGFFRWKPMIASFSPRFQPEIPAESNRCAHSLAHSAGASRKTCWPQCPTIAEIVRRRSRSSPTSIRTKSTT